MRAAELLQLASQKGFNDLRALPVVPEDDNWTYQIKRYNVTTTAQSMVCCVFVCHMWKEGGLFEGVNDNVNCGEFTNSDDYMLTILDGKQNRPQICKEQDPNNQLCQLSGDYTVEFVDYSTRDLIEHMAERCPSEAPDYNRPKGC